MTPIVLSQPIELQLCLNTDKINRINSLYSPSTCHHHNHHLHHTTPSPPSTNSLHFTYFVFSFFHFPFLCFSVLQNMEAVGGGHYSSDVIQPYELPHAVGHDGYILLDRGGTLRCHVLQHCGQGKLWN